jgi:hypothetical protein
MEIAATSFFQPIMRRGTWYWRVRPVYPSNYEGVPVFTSSSFHIGAIEIAEEEVIDPEPEEPIPIPPPIITLIAPSQGTRLDGLTVLRTQTVFRWGSNKQVVSSRFVLSTNANPLQQPMIEIYNPGRLININRIAEGTWYWTVEVEDIDGIAASAPPNQLQVLAIPALPAPENMMPVMGYRIDIERMRNRRDINFSWSDVPGANAYIFSLFELTAAGRRQITQVNTNGNTNWTLENMAVLSRGTFVWQVEAIHRSQGGIIEQRGRAGENSFVIDIPLPGVQANRPGILYGN